MDKYFSVEISFKDLAFVYQFKIWNISPGGLCILVKENSGILNHVDVGEQLDIKYYPVDAKEKAEFLKTEIKHITTDKQGRFKGHCQIGLEILGKPDQNP